MKNQYFGDLSDYHKYGLLRALLADSPLRLGIGWMLTPDDGCSDGRFLAYLADPGRWRGYDPELFDLLHRAVVVMRRRHVRCIERSALLPNTRYYSPLIADEAAARAAYFSRLRRRLADADLVFFDPDNGFEVPSRPPGRKGSCKYLYWDEFAATYRAGHSVMVFQYFTRERRAALQARLVGQAAAAAAPAAVLTFATARVFFLLAAQARHLAHLQAGARRVQQRWADQIRPVVPRLEGAVGTAPLGSATAPGKGKGWTP